MSGLGGGLVTLTWIVKKLPTLRGPQLLFVTVTFTDPQVLLQIPMVGRVAAETVLIERGANTTRARITKITRETLAERRSTGSLSP
jgi:hypothetical protein